MTEIHSENKNFTVTMPRNQTFQNRCESDSKKYKVSPTDKKVAFDVNIQLRSKFCLPMIFKHVQLQCLRLKLNASSEDDFVRDKTLAPLIT